MIEYVAFPQTRPELTSPLSVTDQGAIGVSKGEVTDIGNVVFHSRVGVVTREGTSQQRDALGSPKNKEAVYQPRTQGP